MLTEQWRPAFLKRKTFNITVLTFIFLFTFIFSHWIKIGFFNLLKLRLSCCTLEDVWVSFNVCGGVYSEVNEWAFSNSYPFIIIFFFKWFCPLLHITQDVLFRLFIFIQWKWFWSTADKLWQNILTQEQTRIIQRISYSLKISFSQLIK